MGSNEKRTGIARNHWRMNQRTGCYPELVGYSEKEGITRESGTNVAGSGER